MKEKFIRITDNNQWMNRKLRRRNKIKTLAWDRELAEEYRKEVLEYEMSWQAGKKDITFEEEGI